MRRWLPPRTGDGGDGKGHIVLFALITALCLVGDSMLYVVLPVRFSEMGLTSLWQVGVVLAVNRMVRLPLNPCIGWIYSRIDERTGIVCAVLLATVTTFSYGFLPGFFLWIVVRCLWGVAWTLLRLGSLFCILQRSTDDNRGQYTGLYNGLYRLGSLVGMLAGGILADTVGVRATSMVLGALTMLSLPWVLFCVPRGSGRQPCGSDSAFSAGWTAMTENGRTFLIVCSGGAVALAFQGVVASTLSRLISLHTNGGMEFAGMTAGAASLAGFVQALRWGWEPWLAPALGYISDVRRERPRMLFLSFAAGAAFFLLLALPLPVWFWFCCVLGMQFAATALTTLSEASAADAAGRAGGRSLLMGYALIVDVGAALGPLFAYCVSEFWGLDAVYSICAGMFLVLLLKWKAHMRDEACRRKGSR